MTISRQDKTTSINTQLDSVIPAPRISNLTQGTFMGAVSDNFDERLNRRYFIARLLWTMERLSGRQQSTNLYQLLWILQAVEGKMLWNRRLYANYYLIKQDVINIVEQEVERIKSDPEFMHLVKEEKL